MARRPKSPFDGASRIFCTKSRLRVSVPLENRRVELRAWRYDVKGVRGFEVPVYFLDADLPSNQEVGPQL